MNMPAPGKPRHRAIVAVDVKESTTRTNPGRARLREDLYELLEEALLRGGITRGYCRFVDRGDGALCLIRPADHTPKTVLFTAVIPSLADSLARYARSNPAHALRLRVAAHAGEVHYDRRGVYGEDVDIACRLLDSEDLKARLDETTAPLVLMVSGEIYRSIIRHDYEGIDHRSFTESSDIPLGGRLLRGWTHVPAAVGIVPALSAQE